MTRFGRALGALNWKYALGELTLIFFGVLIALTASAWWERRQQDRRASVYVDEFVRDLDATIAELDTLIALDSSSVAHASLMLAFLRSADVRLPPQDSVQLWQGFRYPRFEPVTATVDQLLQTGDLTLIRDNRLRRQITAYASMLRNTSQQLGLMEQVFHEQTNVARERIETHTNWQGSWRDRSIAGSRTYGIAALRRDPELRAAYMNSIIMQRTHLGRLRTVRQEAVTLKRLIELSPSAQQG